ncbi:transmembrane protein 45B-like [Lolium rigidum]|uniref:transmembrane protein 45B-like n=1 Tax=Lolium rigidum TaxID=89674 RepID=UPI001F5DC21E|nr:transmembrane protein 45B-like [Lolium rigidum]
MGTLVGHVAPGAGFLLIGLWQLFNHIRLFSLRPSSYAAPVWFPARRVRHLELILVIVGTAASILMELVIGPAKHQPFDDDGTIPSDHLHNFEHASISLALLAYAAVTIHLDRVRAPMRDAVSQLVAAAAFAQQLLIFHLHSADHMGVEGQFHWLLQGVIAVTLATTLLGIPFPRSFVVSLVRSASLVLQGVWFVVMGVMLWTPALIPKGCFLNFEEGHEVVRCRTDEALHRAKSLVNLQFSWYLTATVVFVVVFYLQVSRLYPEEPQYLPLVKGRHADGDRDVRFSIGDDHEDDDDEDDLEAAKRSNGHVVSSTKPMEVER